MGTKSPQRRLNSSAAGLLHQSHTYTNGGTLETWDVIVGVDVVDKFNP